jgi:hypothetical protein
LPFVLRHFLAMWLVSPHTKQVRYARLFFFFLNSVFYLAFPFQFLFLFPLDLPSTTLALEGPAPSQGPE